MGESGREDGVRRVDGNRGDETLKGVGWLQLQEFSCSDREVRAHRTLGSS